MKLNRDLTNKINWFLDNFLPPILRDNKIFMGVWFRILFGKKMKYFMEFKEKAPFLTGNEREEYYHVLYDKHIKRDTDLNAKSIDKILGYIKGDTVLDVGCGKGYLAKKIAENNIKVTGIDINLQCGLLESRNPLFIKDNIEKKLPFLDKSFDTVICAHTIEHLLNPEETISELRRVARKRLIVVVPRQREYKYTFDLHLFFFPYIFSLQKLMKNKTAACVIIDNDIFYCEDIT
ncbi:MAG: class I SAM-dependent methyltransferase [Candidatus Omnitrophota bacterium]|nr:class I SAM-dependent methyltransferase [Candidatus Omnitrophota bacterium]